MTKISGKQGHARKYYRVLTIAGSDSSGGAGIQADLKTISALGCYGMSVITALTAQNTKGVSGIHAVPASFAADQMAAVFTDIGADAVKIGMLFSVQLIEVVAAQLQKYRAKNIVLDPVMVAQSGDTLLQEEAIDALKKHLMPLADVITPNIPEAEVLLNCKVKNLQDMRDAAKALSYPGTQGVLIKGGHLSKNGSTDFLYLSRENRTVMLKEDRIKTRNNHGTGCTLSSAIAAYMAKGFKIEDAVRQAKIYITKAIRAGADYKLGSGHGPVHHFFEFWQ
jgi:hydroxymethylpyrimidine/phosphomethylpyrimidine kinase